MRRIRRIYADSDPFESVASVSSVVHSARMSLMATETNTVAILVDDIFFTAKINSAAAECGRQIERVKSREQLEGLVAKPPSLVIIDLNSDRLDPLETIGFFKSRKELSAVPIVSFVSHVQTDLIRAAQAAGCDYVLPRSAFTQMLPKIVSGDLSALRPKP
jgi:DNA-binding NarL/FixJ family response regulator